MATITIHAGMPKAGSSSIQHWLTNVPASVLSATGTTVVVARPAAATGEGIDLSPHVGGNLNSGWIIEQYARRNANHDHIAEAFACALATGAGRYGDILISSEAFAQPFWKGDRHILGRLNELAGDHRVRIAYYVRPQPSSLEAAWRQWGFRTGLEPSTYLKRRSVQLHYFQTLSLVRSLAPRVSFELRPFRVDLLDSSNVVVDFARQFLGLTQIDAEPADLWTNRGLPLEIVNLLRAAPQGTFWSDMHDNSKLRRMKQILEDLTFPTSAKTAWSRQILSEYCYTVFEEGNLRLIAELGWHTPHFISRPSEHSRLPELETIDELWTPQASEPELMFVFRMMEHALSNR